MGTVQKPHTFLGDEDAKASEVNANFDAIYNEFNGSIDENNIDFNRAELQTELKELIFKSLYEVGDLWTTTQKITPSEKFGFGTWERFGEGKVLVGVDSTDTDFDTAEKTGGEKEHTLTESEMPSHNHSGSGTTGSDTHNHTVYGGNSHTSTSNDHGITGIEDDAVRTKETTNDTHTHSFSFTTSTEGSDEAHNNLQPYITVYMWKIIS